MTKNVKPEKKPHVKVGIPEELWAAASLRATDQFLTPEGVIHWILGQNLGPELARIREQRTPAPPAQAPKPVLTIPADIERSTRGSGFKGVYPHGARFRAVFKNGTLGVYDTAEEAAIARYEVIKGEEEGAQTARKQTLDRLDEREAVARAARQRQQHLAAPYTRNGKGQAVATPLYASDGKTIVLTSEERATLLLEKGLKKHEIVLANGKPAFPDGEATAPADIDGEATAALTGTDGEAATAASAADGGATTTCWCGEPATTSGTCAAHVLDDSELAAIDRRVRAGAARLGTGLGLGILAGSPIKNP